ncbi:hypothetical protein LTR84_011574 [Exophiala bonariae]|uniref:DUF1917-domain-containing protein n=1 Tax=Exophiala bonariae TaxID=1690606 RepID=A0AAV9NKT8_9EURO|nr:hypothetical protein LTR84_011574 [Exophiala bonariae]
MAPKRRLSIKKETISSTVIPDPVEWGPVPDDCFSEESDFYGSPATVSKYNRLSDSYHPEQYWGLRDRNPQVIAIKGQEAAWIAAKKLALELEDRARKEARENAKRIKLEERNEDNNHASRDSDGTLTPDDADRMDLDLITPAETEPKPSEHHKSNNTIRAKSDADDAEPMCLDPTPSTTTTSRSSEQRKPVNYYEGTPTAKQLSETLDEFLDRLPPSSTPRSQGPWIWIANPYPPQNSQPESSGDLGGFKQAGFNLLESYQTHREELQAQNPTKPAGSITRMMKTERDKLEPAILSLAREKRILNGKWMIFPPVEDADRVWRIVAEATWKGKLGTASKVATYDENDESARAATRIICVYTADFTDESDVTRVLLALCDLGLVDEKEGAKGDQDAAAATAAKVIYYKCDAYTYLDLTASNEFKLKASMYNSRDLLRKERRSRAIGASGFVRSG